MGRGAPTGYFHGLTLTIEDVESFLAEVAKVIEEKPGTLNILSDIIPAQRTANGTILRASGGLGSALSCVPGKIGND